MPAPSVLNRHGFAEFDESGLPSALIEAVRYPRSHASSLLAALPGKRASIEGNPHLSASGIDTELRQALRSFEADTSKTSEDAVRRADQHRLDAQGRIHAKLFVGVEGSDAAKRDALAEARRDLSDLAHDAHRESRGVAIPTDTGTGLPFLAGGTDSHKMLWQVVSSGPIEDAKLLTLAALRAGPIARYKLGGEGVGTALVATLSARLAETDPEVAEAVQQRSVAERVSQVIRGDRSSALSAACRALGLPKDALPSKAVPIFFPALTA